MVYSKYTDLAIKVHKFRVLIVLFEHILQLMQWKSIFFIVV